MIHYGFSKGVCVCLLPLVLSSVISLLESLTDCFSITDCNNTPTKIHPQNRTIVLISKALTKGIPSGSFKALMWFVSECENWNTLFWEPRSKIGLNVYSELNSCFPTHLFFLFLLFLVSVIIHKQLEVPFHSLQFLFLLPCLCCIKPWMRPIFMWWW